MYLGVWVKSCGVSFCNQKNLNSVGGHDSVSTESDPPRSNGNSQGDVQSVVFCFARNRFDYCSFLIVQQRIGGDAGHTCI